MRPDSFQDLKIGLEVDEKPGGEWIGDLILLPEASTLELTQLSLSQPHELQ